MLNIVIRVGLLIRELGCVVVLGYAGLLILVSVAPMAGQSGTGEIERRVALLEGMGIEKRLTILETVQETEKESAWWHKGSGVGVGLLLGERALLVLTGKKRVGGGGPLVPSVLVTPGNAKEMWDLACAAEKKKADKAALKAAATGSLRAFIEQAWHVVEPATPFVGGWNLDAVCEHLEGVSRGQIRNLVINVPPRTAKSLIVSVFWPAWNWTWDPTIRWLFSSYTSKLSLRDSMKCRRVIDSTWYKSNWGEVFQLIGDQNTKENYENDKTGQRIATSVSGIGVGAGGDRIVCLVGSTMIETNIGALPIQTIVDGKYPIQVLSFSHAQRRVEFKPIEVHETSIGRPAVQVRCSNGFAIECTEDHPIFVESRDEHSTGSGYVPALKLKVGDRVFRADQLSRLQEGILSVAGARGAGEKRDSGVQHQVLRGVSEGKQQPPVPGRFGGIVLRDLQDDIPRETIGTAEEKCTVLLKEVPDRSVHGTRQSKIQKILDLLCGMFSPTVVASEQNWETQLLRPPVRKSIPSEAHQGGFEPTVSSRELREKVPCGVSGDRTEDQEERHGLLSSLWKPARARDERVRRPSHGLHDGEQSDFESDNALSVLPWEGSRIAGKSADMAETVVLSIERIPTPSRVFNVRVADNHNYFANGILVHNCDDPNNTEEVESEVMRNGVLDWWDHTMSTRGNNPKTVARVIVQQRLHEEDLSGHVLQQGGYTHLMLPMRFEIARRCTTTFGGKTWTDPRAVNGEFLWPDRFGEKEISELEKRLGSYMSAGQLQQNPAPIGGGILKSMWWGYWQPRGANLSPVDVAMPDGFIKKVKAVEIPDKFDMVLQSWDMAFKDLETSDYVVGGVLAARAADRFVLDLERGQFDLPKTLVAVRKLSARNPMAYMKIVEDKANGPAVIQTLHTELGGFIAVNPIGGKIARAAAGSPEVEAGNWYLPHPLLAEWVPDFIAECASFPKGSHDDQVDMWSQGAARLRHIKPSEDEQREQRTIQSRSQAGWTAS